jgi:acetylornithine/N-succinyldiaminopimelate aminotransferase
MTRSQTRAGTGRLMDTYPPQPVTFVEGRGTELFDDRGKRYLDFLSGLAVTSLGHAHPEVAEAIASQAGRLLHVSNLFATEPGPRLAALLDDLIGGGGMVFFCNSGAEANEAAIKLARKWGGSDRYVVLTADGSFHGRTLATLHATGQPEKHGPFQPLPAGFRHVAWNDIDALTDAMTEDVAAVLLEPIQGEGGVRPAEAEYLTAVERACREHEILFMVDEVQTGLARTGEWFAFQHYGVSPDVVTMAKALGNGMPIGATWAKTEVAEAFRPGDHATTFGGQPLAAAAALKVVEVMMRINAPERAKEAGTRLRSGLEDISEILGVRGHGLLLAAELATVASSQAVGAALEAGLIVNAVTPTALRLAPPLTVTDQEISQAIEIIGGVLS